ncbi:MAG TPA: toluene-4-monooxygenase system B family protein [Kofleriaceae bacterium]|nr:toluene-4-monooxygenase system B family protein [Kofleriaceae bacterium]
MTAVPLYCFVEGDSLGVLVLVDDHESVAELAQQAQQAAAVRVAPRPHVMVYAHGAVLDRDATVKEIGLIALDRIDVVEGP